MTGVTSMHVADYSNIDTIVSMTPDNGSVTFTGGSSNGAVLFSTSTEGYGGVAVHLTGAAFTATVTFEGSNDNTNWNTIEAVNLGTGAGTTTIASTNNIMWLSAHVLYVRARITAYTSGTVNGTAVLRRQSIDPIAGTITLAALPAGTNTVGAIYPTVGSGATSGPPAMTITNARFVSAATTNGTQVKASAGRLCGGSLSNTTAAWKYVRFYNIASGLTVGSSTIFTTIALPPNSTIPIEPVTGMGGLYFSTGIAMSITGASPDNDTTAVAVGDVLVSLLYL